MKRSWLLALVLAPGLAACHARALVLARGGEDLAPAPPADAGAPGDLAVGDAAAHADLAPPAANDLGPTAPLHVDPSGAWSITFARPDWTFGGQLGSPARNIVTVSGSDAVGSYHETSFDYDDINPKSGSIRRYDDFSIGLFTATNAVETANGASFPLFSQYPQLPYHLAYQDQEFAPYSFSALAPDSPWIFFDDAHEAFVLSPASHYSNAALTRDGSGAIASGIDAAVTTLPAGFTQRTVLAADSGINAAFERWGHALTSWSGKTRPLDDATVELRKLGYWTDNGATYYYNYDSSKGYAGTITAVRDYFVQLGFPLGYMQLDSWWYPKGAAADWSDRSDGIYSYGADATLFPSGLASFQQALGLPLVTHARWIDPSSPYRSQYTFSNNVITDPGYWNSTALYLKSAGVITYEQDWMNELALARSDNLVDEDAFLDGMAAATAEQGLDLQYCMPLPRHYLQSTRYRSSVSIRVNEDRFTPDKWLAFFFGSRLASAVGLWPWSDVFATTEEGNLTLATLSGGLVGVGDALGAVDADILARAVRSDGVIVKPDAAIVPLDQSFVDGARGSDTPMVAATWSDLGGERASYVFVFAAGATQTFAFSPAALGYSGRVRAYDFYGGSGVELAPSELLRGSVVDGRAYFVIVPIGPSGIAFLGDAGKYASLGRQRIAGVSDNGQLHVGVVFGAGETALTLHGYAPRAPTVTASLGGAGALAWDAPTQHFTVRVTPVGGAATIAIAP